MEILSGDAGRRRWSESLKARIVAESLAPGVMITEIARRHGARASQVHLWRKDAREGRLVLPAEQPAPERLKFAPMLVSPEKPPARPSKSSAASVEIEAKGVIVRIRDGADIAIVEAITRALRARP